MPVKAFISLSAMRGIESHTNVHLALSKKVSRLLVAVFIISTISTSLVLPFQRSFVRFEPGTCQASIDNHFMKIALKEAERAYRCGEVPIGAIVTVPLVLKEDEECMDTDKPALCYRIIGRGHNLVERKHDATAHAEMIALRRGAEWSRNWRITNSTLYSTLEPCPMCLSASQAFRVHRIVYGAPDLRLGAIETYINLLDVGKHPYHSIEEVIRIGGDCESESAHLMRSFFRERRLRKQNVSNKKGIFFQWLKP